MKRRRNWRSKRKRRVEHRKPSALTCVPLYDPMPFPQIITVGIGDDDLERELESVASPPVDKNVHMLNDMPDLSEDGIPEDVRSGVLGCKYFLNL